MLPHSHIYLPQPIPQKQAGPLSPRRKREGFTESWRGFQRTNSAATASPRFVVPRGNKLTLTITPNHSHNAWICGPMLAILGVLQVVETQHICLIEPIFWMHVFLYLPKKNMKNGMILPFVTSNMLTRKRPFPHEGSLSLVFRRWRLAPWAAGPRARSVLQGHGVWALRGGSLDPRRAALHGLV